MDTHLRELKTCFHTHLYTKVHSSLIHNNKILATTPTPVDEWTVNMQDTAPRAPLSHAKERTVDTRASGMSFQRTVLGERANVESFLATGARLCNSLKVAKSQEWETG